MALSVVGLRHSWLNLSSMNDRDKAAVMDLSESGLFGSALIDAIQQQSEVLEKWQPAFKVVVLPVRHSRKEKVSGVSRAQSMRTDWSKDEPPDMAEGEREQQIGHEPDTISSQDKHPDLLHIFELESREDWRTSRRDWMTAGKDRTGRGRLVTQPTAPSLEGSPTPTTKNHKKQQPGGPPRGGMEDGSNRTDHTVTTATETDFENTPGNEEKILRRCECGWEKVTTFRGVRIHQGRAKCGQKGQQQPCTATAGETRGTKSQDKNHSANGPNIAGGMRVSEEEVPLVENVPSREHEDPVLTTSHRTEPNAESRKPARRNKIKWPKSSEAEAWRALDADLIKTLEGSLHGGVETKLNLIGDFIYQTCKDRFGEVVPRQRTTLREKGRREKEILQLVQKRRQLRKNWRKATQAEKEGLKALWEEVRKRLAGLRRAERIRKRNRRKEKERASFFKDPFKHARQLLEEKKTGKLETTREQLEQHVREQYSDPQRSVPLGAPGYVPQPAQPTAEFNIMPLKLSKVRQVVEKARSSLAPGPNGVPYKLYKNCPKVLELLWYLMRTAWKKKIIPSEWQRAVAVFIPKEMNSKDISQFRSIALLNVEGKIFFSVLARRMTRYLLENGYIDTNCQKAGVSGFPGCVLEEEMVTFLKTELQRFKQVLSPDYQEDFEMKSDDESDARECVLKMALHFLCKMEHQDLADKLNKNELNVICQKYLKINLKNKYQSVFEGIVTHGSSVLLQNIYTDLYITEGGSGKVNVEHEVRQIEYRSKRSADQDKLIKCADIFKGNIGQDKPIRRVLTTGVAGIGKTISVQKYILDWAEENAHKEIDFIFPMCFRELNLMRDEKWSLMGLIHHFTTIFFTTKQLTIVSQKKYKVLFVFDGLDECRLQLNFQKNENLSDERVITSLDVLLTNLIKGNLLPSALLWITSRPAAASQIPPECIDLATEVQGFNDAQKEEYFRNRISNEGLARRIISHIKSSRSLYIMCHIPVFTWIAATVLEMIYSSGDTQVPKTLTEMYTYFLIFQTRQRNMKFDNVHDIDTHWNHELILHLGKLAYEQLEKGNLIFYDKDLRDCGIDVQEATVYSGMCTQIFREESGIFLGTVFCFVHLSIQEYLAALYAFLMVAVERTDIISSPHSPPVMKSIITLHKSAVDKALAYEDGRFDLFLRFLLGLSLESNQTLLHGLIPTRQIKMDNDETIKYIKEKIREASSSERMINLFHCLNELNDQSLVQEIQSFLSAGTLSEVQLSPGQWSALVFVLLTSDQNMDVFDLKKFIRSDEALLRLQPVVEESQTTLVGSCGLTEQSGGTLASVLCKKTSKLRHLELSDNCIGDVGLQQLCDGLKSPNCVLETLRLSDCGVTGRGYAALASALKSNPSHLEELDLRGNDPGDSGVKLLIDLLQDPQCKLKRLRFNSCSITEEGCAALSLALSSNPSHLTDLDLSENELGDSGVMHISALLRNPDCKLQKLGLDSCSVTEEGCAALTSNHSSHLTYLFLGSNKLGDSGVKHISALLRNPDCKLQKLA
ncbi:NACHT, LRR and PYD domains-containing protein 3-like [Engraulis encrasicolus]|uniref:NACHT, LRR and PYD domains-containing protein 3-like n=1 Tax=Engraulis encrasicolus TaxID=184585 RepID=UPI002FD7183B